MPVQWDHQDWRKWSRDEQAIRWQEFLVIDRRRNFDLRQPPLMRLNLFQTGDSEHQFVWSHPHILLDGWSVQLLLNDLFACYAAECEGRKSSLPPVRPYREYIAWLQRQDRRDAEKFWRSQLRGFEE